MQHIIQEIVDTLEGFVNDEEQAVMLIEAKAEEAPLLLKTFGMIEESENSPDIYLSFGDEFQDIRRYVELVLERQRDQIEQLNVELEKQNRPLLKQISAELFERNRPSHERLIGLFRHIRKIVEPQRQIIWVFYPITDVEREEFFVNLFEPVMNALMNGEIAATKLIIRDTPSQKLKEKFRCDNPKIVCYRPDLDFKSVMAKVEQQSKNKDAPVEERVQSMMLMAGMDVAEKRYKPALAKNQRVLAHYQKTNQKQNESVVQNNIGDIYYIQGDYPEAQKNYEKAITISVDEKSQPMVLYQSLNLGNALFMQQKYDEALIYYDSAEKLAELNKILIQRVQAMERIGDTKRAKGELDEAIVVYENAAHLCRENKYTLGLKGVLQRLCDVHAEKRDQEKYDECAAELGTCKEELAAIDPHFADA